MFKMWHSALTDLRGLYAFKAINPYKIFTRGFHLPIMLKLSVSRCLPGYMARLIGSLFIIIYEEIDPLQSDKVYY